MAALLWAGHGAVLFGGSAGYAWGLVRAEPDVVHVAVPYPRHVSGRPGVAIRRSRTSGAHVDAHAWPHRIASTHTVFDLADGRPLDRAVMLAARALDLKLCTADQLVTALASRRRQADRRVLLELLSDVADGSNSAAELRTSETSNGRKGCPRSSAGATGDGRRRDVEYEDRPGRRDRRSAGTSGVGRAATRRRRDRRAAVTGRLTIRAFWPTWCRHRAFSRVTWPPSSGRAAGEVNHPRVAPTCSLREGSVPLGV